LKSIQLTALFLWLFIFVVASFVLGQFLVSKNIFDVTTFLPGQEQKDIIDDETDNVENDVVIDKVGQETVRIGLNIANNYFSDYYKEYVNYVMHNSDSYPSNQDIQINDTLATEYVFYAVSRNIDNDKYESVEENNNVIIKEAEINSFADKVFGKEIDEAYKKDGKYGYDNNKKEYAIERNTDSYECIQELENIENITSNELKLIYSCRSEKGESTVKLSVIYKGGRYLVTQVLKED